MKVSMEGQKKVRQNKKHKANTKIQYNQSLKIFSKLTLGEYTDTKEVSQASDQKIRQVSEYHLIKIKPDICDNRNHYFEGKNNLKYNELCCLQPLNARNKGL